MLKIFRVHSSSFCERDAIIIWYAADERISSLEVIKLTLQQLFNASQYALYFYGERTFLAFLFV